MPFSLEVQPSGLPPKDLDTQLFHFLNVVTDSEFSCLAKLAKPYPMYSPTYLPQVLNQLHSSQNCAYEVCIQWVCSEICCIPPRSCETKAPSIGDVKSLLSDLHL